MLGIMISQDYVLEKDDIREVCFAVGNNRLLGIRDLPTVITPNPHGHYRNPIRPDKRTSVGFLLDIAQSYE